MFVEMLTGIASSFENLGRQDKVINELKQNNEIAQQRADTAKLNAENRKRELDIIENGMRNWSINQYGKGVHAQIQPVRAPEREE